jgi:hypothetical protein
MIEGGLCILEVFAAVLLTYLGTIQAAVAALPD